MLETDIPRCWRCDFCSDLIYNIVWTRVDGVDVCYPAPGAPPPRYLSFKFQKVCVLCFDLAHSLDDNIYFRRIQAAFEEEQEKSGKGTKQS